MSLKLSELQDIAEKMGPEYFIGENRMVCLHSTMYAVNDALKEADDIDYVPPDVVKASSGLVAGLDFRGLMWNSNSSRYIDLNEIWGK